MTIAQQLRDGAWAGRGRAIRTAALLLLMTILCTGWLLFTAHGTVDRLGRPIGTDFSDVWTAGWMADHGQAAAAWDWKAHYAIQQRIHGRADIPFYGWHYPPPFLLVAAALARLPYLAALALWQGATIAAALVVVHRIVPERATILVALGFPATFVCLGHGQNGFLTAALLGGGLLLLDRRPWLAGALLGALIYKPQFAPVLPVLLLTGRHWRAIGGAAASAATLVALTTLVWGTDVWVAFRRSLPLTRHVVIEGMNTGAWKVVSPFAAVRLNGGGIGLAYTVAIPAALAALGLVAFASPGPPRVRNAVVIAAAFLTTPYVFDYDMVALGIAIAFLVAEARASGWRSWERTILAAAYLIPIAGRQIAAASGVPLDLLGITAVLGVALRRMPPRGLRAPRLGRRVVTAAIPALTPSPSRH